ncbi:DUF2189 domain-containing protein [Paracoccus sp. IB05]|uniref:DUF2189 domain-containing protein n=1 Tax=Paracoccus sp. IB05 TaxID=2779367 RepID=UPI0018E78D73|nr:DUF2189 domain-containing protein [Paracoccus sp. IB05]MBJ2150794.1 DUF2189 domain-containing protein [Paracoccus sp. IB05]
MTAMSETEAPAGAKRQGSNLPGDRLPGARPEVLRLDPGDLRYALKMGWQDFRRAPGWGLFFALIYVLGGWLVVWALTTQGQFWWTLPAAAGFPILGPFIACGLYEVSRRLSAGRALEVRAILGVIFAQKDGQIPSMAAMIVCYFLFWNFFAHMSFALFMGNVTMTNVSQSLAVFATPPGIALLVFGTLTGAAIAALLFALTVVSLPMLLDRDIDYVTAMLASLALVRENPVLMLGWGGAIALFLFLAMLPGFLGLFIVLPLLGHASWHLYRRAIDWPGEDALVTEP